MKRLLLLGIALLIFITQVFSLTIVDTSIQSITSNTTINFTRAVNTSLVTIGDDFVSLENFTFNESELFWEDSTTYTNNISLFNYSTADTEVFTGNFLHYFRFNDTISGNLISNYTFGDFTNIYTNLSVLFTNLGIEGNKTWDFEQFGFITTSFTFPFSYDAFNNITFNISRATMLLYIYDRDTGLLINDSTSTITLVATVGFNTTTTTGTVNISNFSFQSESYQIIISNPNYESESIYFDFTNQELLTLDAYLIKSNQSNLGTHTVKALSNTGELINNAVCSGLEWDPVLSAFKTVVQGLTDENGETVLNIELGTKLYKFQCTKAGITGTSINKILTTTGLTTPIVLADTPDTPVNIFETLTYSLVNETLNATHQRITFTFADSSNVVNIGCLKIYKVIGTQLTELQSSCVATSSGQIQLIQDVNQTYLIRAVSSIVYNSKTQRLDVINFESSESLDNGLSNYGLDIILPLLAVILGIASGFLLRPKMVYLSIIVTVVLVWFARYLVPTALSTNIAMFITIVSGFMLWGAYKFK